LPNRVLLGRALEALTGTSPAALFMLDLDRFKDVNDTLGHATGDTVLTILGQRLRSVLPEENLIARIGGDEFAVVVPSYTDTNELKALASSVLERIRSPIKTGQNTIEVGASIGIALCPEHGADGGVLLQRADVAMYVAKKNRTSIELYDAGADRSSVRHLEITGALRAAIANDELDLFYQPKVRLSDLRCVGVEALARWTHRELGAVSPGEFVPLAEESNLIVPLTRWALMRALADHAEWRTAGVDIDLAVNLSARHLRDPSFAMELLQEVERHAVDPRRIELEITETALMSDPEKAMEVLRILTGAGIRIAMDDFGTGFSSLAYLRHLNLNTLKIDRCFIKDITNNSNDLTIVRSTLRMAHSLELEVVAEGIEERSHYEMLRELGCDVGQGYWIAKPMPAVALPTWVDAWERGRQLQRAPIQAA
jgi:diguanylate cyclase (GGDEF)-like protein